MIRWIAIVLIGFLTSLFLFPFNLPIALTVNTKMIVALLGLIVFGYDLILKRSFSVSRDFLILSVICVVISIWAFFITLFNGTDERAFVTYFISVWVWLGGAYAVVWFIRLLHGNASLEIIGRYIAAVCVAQCALAFAMSLSPQFKSIVDGMMGEGDQFMGIAEGRMYGLGAALDPAGLRFGAALVILAHLFSTADLSRHRVTGVFYLISVFIIVVVGNMIARTTIIGFGLGLAYLILKPLWGQRMNRHGSFMGITLISLFAGIGLCIILYNTNPIIRSNIRFGFEGFFSLVEHGRWEVHSTNILKDMVVWPESAKTWAIGDGFFDNPADMPDILGRVSRGFYMHTDIGYLRYIFYFGIIGLVGMIAVFVQITVTCCRKLGCVPLFIFLLLLNLIGWVKVSSDLIMVFAPFLVLAYTQKPKCEVSLN